MEGVAHHLTNKMKKLALSILVAALGTAGAMAAPVTKERASATATAYLKAMTGRSYAARQVLTNEGAYYVVNMAPDGWVIISADDAVKPIIGFSDKGSISWHSVPSNVKHILDQTAKGIRYAVTVNHKPNPAWRNASIVSRSDDEDIPPLIAAKWDQTYPYNMFCPPFDAGATQRVYNGCVAVAMGQAMSVQKWPNQPRGKKEYSHSTYGAIKVDYDLEPAYNWDYICANPNANNTPDKGQEIARLLFHTGVSVSMNYGPTGSGIPSNEANRIEKALKNNFGYGADVRTCWKYDGYTDDTWAQLIYNELNAGRAVVYNAISRGSEGKDAGHSFNVCGYKAGLYYVNWGWGGSYNGYYDLTLMDPPGYKYNDFQVCITGIGSPERVLRSIELSDVVIEENLPAGTVTGIITVNGETPKPEFILTCSGGYDAVTLKNKEVPFEIKGNYLQTTRALTLADCERDKNGNILPIDVQILAVAGQDRLKATFRIQVLGERTVEQATSLQYNRANGNFDLHSRHGSSFRVLSPSGAELAKGQMNPLPYATFNASMLEKGTNKLVITDGKTSKELKIVK